jgi:hypothetical protein
MQPGGLRGGQENYSQALIPATSHILRFIRAFAILISLYEFVKF